MQTHFDRIEPGRPGWLRAAVLGADDGILSTASLMIGVAGSGAARDAVLTAGLAGLGAGSLAMAIGEYVSVSSQSDTEAADAAREGRELVENPEAEHLELARTYHARGLPVDLADEVATALMASDPLGVAGAAAGGASLRRGGLRVAAGGVLAMLITFGIGHLFGTATGT